MLKISDDLKKLLEDIPDMDKDLFLDAVTKPLPECFRVNTLKLPEEEIVSMLKERGWEFEPISWARYGYRLLDSMGEQIGASLEHMAGLIYLQGPISMLPAEVLDVRPGRVVLDLCAAPGSKATQIAQLMENNGVLVCNDVSSSRIKPLVANLQRFGVYIHVVTQSDGRRFYRWGREMFDRVLVDVPCSSLGIISKDWGAAKTYSNRISDRISKLQRSLLLSAYDCLRINGILVYSTCTIHPLENEAVIDWFLEQRPSAEIMEVEANGLRRRKPLEEWGNLLFKPEIAKCFKAYPQDNMAEGFFVAKIRRLKI